MNKVKKWTLLFLIVVLAMTLFRSYLFRFVFHYKTIGQRIEYKIVNEKLYSCIKSHPLKDTGIQAIIDLSLEICSEQLSFTTGKCENDPNLSVESHVANCIGYSAFFSSVCKQLLMQNNLSETWSVHSEIGQIHCFNNNVHPYFNSPFFKDHDFVLMKNKKNGDLIAIDPSLYDYACIKKVRYEP